MAIGSAFQAAVGLGVALIAVPILAFADPAFVPGPMLLAGTVLAFVTAWRERHAIDGKALSLSIVGLVFGTLIGALTARALVGSDQLPRIFAIVILLAVVVSLFGKPFAMTSSALVIAGTLSGVMGTLAGFHGPAIALIFQNEEPAVARAMLGAFFAIAYLIAVGALAAVGLFGVDDLRRSAILLPGVFLGLALAPLLRKHIDRKRLRITILGFAAISGLVLLAK